MLNLHVFCAVPGAGKPAEIDLAGLGRILEGPYAKYRVSVLGEIPLVLRSSDKSGSWCLLQITPVAATKELGGELFQAGVTAMKRLTKAVDSVKDNPDLAGPWAWETLEKLVPLDSPLRSKSTTTNGITVPGDGKIMTAGVIFGESTAVARAIDWSPAKASLDDPSPVTVAELRTAKAVPK